MDCPFCRREKHRVLCSDGLLHSYRCAYAPEACPHCKRRPGIEYGDGKYHDTSCDYASDSGLVISFEGGSWNWKYRVICSVCSYSVGEKDEDGLGHSPFCAIAPGACPSCYRRPCGVGYLDGQLHGPECKYYKYEKATRRAKKHKETMQLLGKTESN